MARRPASGRGWTDDGRATGKSFRHPMEAWWKHEGKNRCAILTICARAALADPAHNWRKPRNNSRFRAIVHGSFDTTHNLKVVGSNPTPATKLSCEISNTYAALRAAFACRVVLQAPPEHSPKIPKAYEYPRFLRATRMRHGTGPMFWGRSHSPGLVREELP